MATTGNKTKQTTKPLLLLVPTPGELLWSSNGCYRCGSNYITENGQCDTCNLKT